MFNGDDVRLITLNKSFIELQQKSAPVSFNVVADTLNENHLKLAIEFE